MKVIVTHHPCSDGFGARYAAWLRYHNQAEYLDENHNGYKATAALLARPDVSLLDVTYFDICPSRDLLEQLHKRAKSVTVIDHHEKAEEKCGDLPYVHIDQTRSGAVLAWQHLFPSQEVPFILLLVEDRDLWNWKIPHSQDYLLWLELQGFSYESWHRAHRQLQKPTGRAEVLAEGQAYTRFQDYLVNDRIITTGNIRKLFLGGHVLAAVNSPTLQSEIGNKLTVLTPASAIYHRTHSGWSVSLRSTDQGPNVNQLAQLYGGGGHPNASGFRVDDLDELIFESYTLEELNKITSILGK